MRKILISSTLALLMSAQVYSGSFFEDDFDFRINELHKEINNIFKKNDMSLTRVPKMDISEEDKSYTILFEVPGIDKKDLNVTIKDEKFLTITGHQKDTNSNLSFSRSISLPENINIDKITISHKNGVLKLIIPKDSKKLNNRVKTLTID